MVRPARPWSFLIGCLVTSVPFGLMALATDGKPLFLGLPVSVVFIVYPAVAATILSARDGGAPAVRGLWARLSPVQKWGDSQTGWIPWTVAFAYPVLAWLISFYAGPAFGIVNRAWTTAPVVAPLLFLVYLGGAVLEEIGWSCYATGPCAARCGPTICGLVIGATWAMVHWLSWLAMGRSYGEVAAMSASTVVMRVVMTRLYLVSHATAASSVLLHAMSNTLQSYPSGFTGVNPYLWLGGATVVGVFALAALSSTKGASGAG